MSILEEGERAEVIEELEVIEKTIHAMQENLDHLAEVSASVAAKLNKKG